MRPVREIRKKWPPRKPKSHKGDFGRIFIIAGSEGLTGAAHLAGMGAVRSGAGLVTVGVPKKVYEISARREAEVMVRPFASTPKGTLAFRAWRSIRSFLKTQDVLAVGPGLSQNSQTQKLIRKIIAEAKIPTVNDADGLNALKGHTEILSRIGAQAVLTPHPGEFHRLFGGSLSSKDSQRRQRAREVASRFGVTLVLKGARTVIAAPSGKLRVNPSGNSGMASGGTGDVLTGIIAGLIGQRLSLWDASWIGVYLHGLAGDLAVREVGEASLAARDLLEYLPQAIRKARGC